MNNIKVLFLQLPKRHRVVLSSFSFLLLLLIVAPSENATASRQFDTSSLEVGKRYQLNLPELHVNDKPLSSQKTNLKASPEKLQWQLAKVKSGDSLAKILSRFGFNARTTYELSKTSAQLKRLKVGDELRLGSNDNGELIELIYPLSLTESLQITRQQDKYVSEISEKQVDTRESYAHATISSNFWNAGIEAGMTDKQIMNLANIFGWDIDFAMDLRKDDHFTVIYEKRYIDGEYVGTGNILAAEFVNRDETFQAIRFKDGEYYTPEGRSMRKAFLRAPVNFKYISSNFKKKRFHPVQKRWKAHRGVDYAASTGTPVVAAGSGKVIKAGYDKYNGHHVFIQHGDGIQTKYIHFSKRKVKKGQRVKQGQLIGLVGSTGLASGPHLHYEFLVNGVHRNPRTVKLPKAKSLDKKYRDEFAQVSADLLSQLEGSKRALLAMR